MEDQSKKLDMAIAQTQELLNTLLSMKETTDEVTVTSKVTTETKPKSKPAKTAGKPAKSEEAPAPTPAPAPKQEIPEDLSITEKVKLVAKDMSNEDLADILTQAGIKPSGKREALIAKLVKAAEDGLIDLSDDDEEEETVPAPAPEKVEEAEAGVELDESDPNSLDNPEITDLRKETMISVEEDILKAFDEGDLTMEAVTQVVNTLPLNDEEREVLEAMSDEEKLEQYIYYAKSLVDDDGDFHDPEEAYLVNGTPYCCATELQQVGDSSTYKCPYCKAEYELED